MMSKKASNDKYVFRILTCSAASMVASEGEPTGILREGSFPETPCQ